MEENIKLTCPCCESVIIVRRRDGKILETREPIVEESSGDRFEDAYQKVKARSTEAERKVAEARRKAEERKRTADDFFKQALERAKGDDEKPHNPLDYQ